MSLTESLRSILFALLAATTLAHASVWTQAGPYYAAPVAFAFVPGAPNTVVVSAKNAVVRSTDGGNTFGVVAGQSGFTAFAAGGPGSNILYGSGSAGVSKSVDGGQSWQVVNSTQHLGSLVAVAPTNSSVIYAAGSGSVVRSANGGASFSAPTSNLQALPPTSLAVSPVDERVVYAGTVWQLFKSTDGAQTFTAIGPAGVLGVRAVAIDPGNAGTLYCVHGDGVYKSTDGGASFAKLGLSIPVASSGSTIIDASLAIDPSDSRSVYVAVRAQLWHSADGGASWSGPANLPGGANDVRLQPADTSLFALGAQLYRSTDDGATWNAVNLGISDELISGLVANPLAPERIFAVGSTGEFISIDGGQHFEPMAALPRPTAAPAKPQTFSADPSRPQIAYFSIPGGMISAPKLLRSLDGGGNWVTLYTPAGLRPPAESFDAFAASPAAGVLQIISSSHGGSVFGTTYLHRSVDDGVTWTIMPIKTGAGAPVQGAQLLLVDPQSPATLYLGGVGFHRSADGGATWTASSSGLSAAAILQLTVDAQSVNTVYAATDAGIYRSVDGGQTWSAFNAGLDTKETFSVLASSGGVVAGTRSGVRWCADQQWAGGAAPQQGTVVEFYNTALNHYFMTANAAEIAGIDAGSAGPGWARTNATFNAWPTAADAPYNASQVYRFYGTPQFGPNSHFYTLSSAEFSKVGRDRGWTYEVGNWFWTMAPTAPGQCPANTTPLYRAYNDRFAFNDSNHRYTASLGVLQSMASQGWIAEGEVMCMPQ